MYRSYQLRLKATQRQAETLTALLLQLCELYNMCLEQITAMAGSHLAKSILDAAWRELIWQITYKADQNVFFVK